MLEWVIETIARWFGISPLAAVGLLVVGSVVVSTLLRWHRSVREQEYYYLELAGSGRELSAADFANPQGYGERILAETPPEVWRRAQRRQRGRAASGKPASSAPPGTQRHAGRRRSLRRPRPPAS